MPEPLLLLLVGFLICLGLGVLLWPQTGLVARVQGRRSQARRVQEQDALKQTRVNELAGEVTTLRGLAHRLGLSTTQTASALAGLESAGLVTLTGEEIHLTQPGREEGARILRAHRLWERHLADDTGFAETEWHEQAERQEHRLTPAETEALARRLGQPASDPHGDPIPTADGEVILHPGRPLDQLPLGTTARISHIEDEPAVIYDSIVASGLAPGAVVQLVEVTSDGFLLTSSGGRHRLTVAAARSISVVPLPGPAPLETPHSEPLYLLRQGERAQVLDLSPRCRGADRRRMLDLGILPGTTIEAVMTSPSGDPTAYRIRDALIALRREQAGLIRVIRAEGPPA